jgi:hypothetical protein
MPRLKYLINTHVHCHDCNAVIPIHYAFANEMAKHSGHRCTYTEVRP